MRVIPRPVQGSANGIALSNDGRTLYCPDTFHLTQDRWLYINAAQVQRRPEYQATRDEQQPPYDLFRIRIHAGPASPG